MKKAALLLLCFFCTGDIFAQTNSGLFFKNDTAHINSLTSWAVKNQRLNPDSAFLIAYKALQLSVVLNYDNGIANASYALGIIHLARFSKNDSASYYLEKALAIYHDLNDKKGMGKVYYGLAYVYSFGGDLAKSEKYLYKSLECYQRDEDKLEIYKVYNSLAYILKQYKKYDESNNYLQQCILLGEELKDTSLLADAHNNLGNLYKDQGLFQPGIDAYFKALELSESISDTNGLAIAYGSIGNLYYYQQDYTEALKYLKKKLPISQSKKNHWEVSKTFNSIAMAYNEMNLSDSAISYLRKSLNLNIKMNYPTGIANVYKQLAGTYLKVSNIDSARFSINKAIQLGEKSETEANLAEYYILKGKVEQVSGNDELALNELLKGYRIAKELNMPLVLKGASLELSNLFFAKNNPLKAYQYLKDYIALKDSLSNQDHLNKITRLEMTYQFNKKKQEMLFEKEQGKLKLEAEMERQRIYMFGASGLFLLIILIGVLFFRQKSLQLKFKAIDLEQKLLKVQMNPHFIFNSLCSIQDFVLRNNIKAANNFLTRFARLIRTILENSRSDFIPIEREIETLKNYLEIQKLRFETDFDYQIAVDEKIDTETYTIPPMMAQPFVENSIEHGLLPKKEKGKLLISYSLNDEMIRFEVSDNGVGRHQVIKNNNQKYEKSSLATLLTLERLKYLKGMRLKKIDFEISDLNENSKSRGTKVVFNIPYKITVV